MDVASRDERGTTQRVLTLLGLVQQRPVWTGLELADRLGVTPRTVRRDVQRLRTLGYPVHASQGVVGGYQFGPGQDLPPLRPTRRRRRRRSPPRSRCWLARVAGLPAPATPHSGR